MGYLLGQGAQGKDTDQRSQSFQPENKWAILPQYRTNYNL